MARFPYKKCAVLCFAIPILGIMDLLILQGNLFMVKAQREFRSTASLEAKGQSNAWAISKQNLTVKNLILTTKTADGLFRKNEPIEISCFIKNTGEGSASFSYVLRTNTKTLAEKKSETLKAGAEKEIRATFTPEESGIVFAACRSDPDKKITEQNENDNREVTALAILP